MDKYIGIKYHLESSEHFEDYLKFLDVGFLSRKTACAVSPTATLTKNNDGSYTFLMSTAFRTVSFSFVPGQEFLEERVDGVKVRSLVEFEGDAMLQTQAEANGRTSRHVRRFSTDSLIVTTTADGWTGTSVRTYHVVK